MDKKRDVSHAHKKGYTIKYEIYVADDELRASDSFSSEEKLRLRPIAETLAMLDGNAFFGIAIGNQELYEQYLPEAWELFSSNGGISGWAGECSWIKELNLTNPAVKAAWEEYQLILKLAKKNQ